MNRTASQVRLGPPLEETMNMWVPLLGYNVRYRENYDINPSSLHVRRSDTGRRVRTTNTGRLMLHGKWVHIADVVRDHRALRLVRNAGDECDDDDDYDEEDYDFKNDSEEDSEEEDEVEVEVQIVNNASARRAQHQHQHQQGGVSDNDDEEEEDCDADDDAVAADGATPALAPAPPPVAVPSNARGVVIWLSTMWNICVLVALIAYIWSRESSATSSSSSQQPNTVYHWA